MTIAIIAANFAVWLFYELHLDSSIAHASFYPCAVDGSCHAPLPWGISWITSMFMHGSWDHILGNMLFLAVFGKNVEDAYGRLRFLAFYFAGGFVATLTQTAMTLLAGSSADAHVPNLGASGAIAAVLGAYALLYPRIDHTRARRGLPRSPPCLILPRVLVPVPALRGEPWPLRRGRPWRRSRVLRTRGRLRVRIRPNESAPRPRPDRR